MVQSPVVYVVIYSLYHHTYKLALSIKEGLESNGCTAKIFQVKETLPDNVLEMMHAPEKPDVPEITVDQLTEPDGILFGIPTRYGIFPAQMKALLDQTGQLWQNGSLSGKFVGTFFSTASQHGGQETTALNAVTYFAHHAMIYVPFGYADPGLSNNDEVVGGSAYGAGTITNGDGSRQPSETELKIAKVQGTNFAKVVTTYARGKEKAGNVSKAVAGGDNNTSADQNNQTNNDATAGAATSGAAATGAATTGAATTGAATTGAATTGAATTGAAAPKKKKGLFWLCCGSDSAD